MSAVRHSASIWPLVGAFLAIPLGACRHHGDFRVQYNEMRPAMVKGDWQTASAQLEKAKEKIYGEKDRVMYWLNLGAVLHYAGNLPASSENLAKAEAAMQELWTKSVTAEASKLLVSETIQSYPGEDFEKVLVYLYTALNNVKMNKIQDARVEARRADELLKKMLVQYEKEGEIGTLYKQDAFMLWLVGLFYEMEGRSGLNDAFLAYKAAYQSYKDDYAGHYGTSMPAYVAEDAVRAAKLLGFNDEVQKLSSDWGASGETADKLSGGGEVVLIHASGEAPFKEEFFIDGTMPDGYVMRIALPKFVAIPSQVAYAEVKADGGMARTEIAEPLTEMVLKNFEHRLPGIQLRAIARATIKYAATKGAEAAASGGQGASEERKLAGALVGLAGNVAAAASEAADLRSWTTLPARVGVARLWLPAGQHQLEVTYHGADGTPIGRTDTISVDLKAGEHQIVSVRSLE